MKNMTLILVAALCSGCDWREHYRPMDTAHLMAAIAICEERGLGYGIETNVLDNPVEVYCREPTK